MAKLKISTYFPHIFSKLSSNFLQLFQMTKLDCFQHRSTNVCKNTVKVKAAFCSNEFLLCHKCVIFWLHGFCVNQRNGFGCVAHKRIYSQWLQRCMMPSVFFCSYPRKKCHGNPKGSPLVRLFLKAQVENKPLTSSKNAVPADPTPALEANLFSKDVQF